MGRGSYWLTRFVLLRLLGVIYLVAFLIAAEQAVPLIGGAGLTPVGALLERTAGLGSRGAGFLQMPSLFWLGYSDAVLRLTAWCGVALALPMVVGFACAPQLALLWALYMSFVHVGQVWYSFGWEIQLLETGFLAIFLVPLLDPRPFPRRPPPAPVVWLYRWLIVRIMLGAGLIKLRGDPCWRDLSCLDFHYETQPLPNPVSWYLHVAPSWTHQAGVLLNHGAELLAPLLLFAPRPLRIAGGATMLAFQLLLILSGNLSFLNYLTIVPILACFDDAVLRRVLPRRLVARAESAAASARPSRGQLAASFGVLALVAALSVDPVLNLLSPGQVMNTSFGALDLVNSYGAFGVVGRERHEIVIEGTRDAASGAGAEWRPYELRCKPGDPRRRPCIVSPYHYRLDWLMWFAAMDSPARYPWTVHLVWKLLHGDSATLSLFAGNPFPEGPPRFVRARLYRYQFAPPGGPDGAWWKRTELGDWLPPLSSDDPRLLAFLRERGWAIERSAGAPHGKAGRE